MEQASKIGPTVLLIATEIATGDEHVVGPGDDESGEVVGLRHPVDGVADPEVHRRGHGIAAMRTIDGQHGDRTVALETQELRTAPVALGGRVREGHGATVLPEAGITEERPYRRTMAPAGRYR